jgi:hypothetical protein
VGPSATSEALRQANVCAVCMASACDVVLVPCGHVLCLGCARALRSCPFDRSAIAHLVKYYAPA